MARYLIIFAAVYLYMIVVLLAAYVWWMLPRPRQLQVVAHALMGLAIAYVLVRLAGALYYHPRPFISGHFTPLIAHNNTNGFPSDHTTYTMLIALVVLPYVRTWGLVLAAMALCVGLARIAAGVHSLPDILGGVVIAMVAATASYYGAQWLIKRAGKKA